MFCRNCGRELPENANFCGGCGAPVFTPAAEPKIPETSAVTRPSAEEPAQSVQQDELLAALAQPAAVVAAPAPELRPVLPVPPAGSAPVLNETRKKGGVWLLAGIAALAVIVLIAAVVKTLPSDSGRDVLVYLSGDDELMFRKDLKVKTKPVELTDDETSGVLFSKDGKYIYYLESDAYSGTGTLYRAETAKIGKKGFSPEKISSDIDSYAFSLNVRVLDNGGAVYIRGSGGDGQLRYYDGKESCKLANGVGDFTVDEKGAYAYYTEYDSADEAYSLYRVAVRDGGEKERIVKDAGRIYSSYDAAVLIYGRSGGSDGSGVTTMDIYSQEPGGDKTRLLSNVCGVLDVTASGSSVSITYTTAQVEEHTLYDFVTDSLASSDAGEQEPSVSDYQTRSAWGWMTTDWDAYEAACEAWGEVEARSEIRRELQNTYYNLTTYTLRRYENGKSTVLAEGLASPSPACSVSDGIFIYAKSSQDVSAVCDVSDLEYWSEICGEINASERIWYQNVNGTESELGLGRDDGVSVNSIYVLNGKEAVLSICEDGETAIQAYRIGRDRLTFSATVTDEDFTGLRAGRNGKQDVLYYMTDLAADHTSGDLMYYADGNKTTAARDASRAVLLDGGKAVFKMEDVKYNSRRDTTECSLYVVKNGKDEHIADDAALDSIAFLDAGRVIYISDGDLFLWNGSASEKLASDVTSFWSSRDADCQVWSPNW